jgi:ATP-dependent helicase HrpB
MTSEPVFPGLPVEETFSELRTALDPNLIAILEAPPGAGKTTLVPLALLNESWLQGKKIIMLEPRRLAARMAAHRMASLLGEKVGETVGYRIRQDRKTGPNTRIEVVTEGILTRQLQSDPELDGIGLVIFDEFHERNLQGDLGLAFCLESQTALRDDLRLLIMSATLDGQRLSQWLDNAPVISSQGRSYNVELRNLPRPDKYSLPQDTSKAVLKAMKEETGNILVFLPGEGEIRKTEALLENQTNAMICPLYGALPPKDQDAAINPPPPGTRKVVLATTIAETSLTIEGIRIVIDCGLKRVARFDNMRGMSRLETVRVSRASAIQRMGRAGRLEDGVCYQLWPSAETQALMDRDRPEILDADLTPLALELAAWGVKKPADLQLLDHPNEKLFKLAQTLLQKLGALDSNLVLTQHGKEMLKLALHPRLAHMVVTANTISEEQAVLACEISAALQDGPVLRGRGNVDLRDSVSVLKENKPQGTNIAKGVFFRARDSVKTLRKRLRIPSHIEGSSVLETGKLLALAYPDRVAKLRSSSGTDYLLSAGMGAKLNEHDSLIGEDFIVVAEMGGTQAQGKIFSAVPISEREIEETFASLIENTEEVGWDKKKQVALANKVRKFGAITLKSSPIKDIDPDLLSHALCKGIRDAGLQVLPWSKEATSLCQRIEFLRQTDQSWPDFSQSGLNNDLEKWLPPFLSGFSRLDHLKKLDLQAALLAQIDWNDQQKLDTLAPTHFKVPSGSHIRIDYSTPEKPVLAVKLQEMFGQPQTPTINQGKSPLQIHLLSPAGRPLQVTEDLESFWTQAYDSVKKEMRGRYPKHPWPDNPIEAVATAKTKRNLR